MDELESLLAKEKSYVLLNKKCCSISCTKIKSCVFSKEGTKREEKNNEQSVYSLSQHRPEPTRFMEQHGISDNDYRWKEIYSWMLQVSQPHNTVKIIYLAHSNLLFVYNLLPRFSLDCRCL